MTIIDWLTSSPIAFVLELLLGGGLLIWLILPRSPVPVQTDEERIRAEIALDARRGIVGSFDDTLSRRGK